MPFAGACGRAAARPAGTAGRRRGPGTCDRSGRTGTARQAGRGGRRHGRACPLRRMRDPAGCGGLARPSGAPAGQNPCIAGPDDGERRASFFDLRGFSLAAAAPPVVWEGGTPRRMPFFLLFPVVRSGRHGQNRPPRHRDTACFSPGCRARAGRGPRPGVRPCKIFVPTGAFRGGDVKKIKQTLDGLFEYNTIKTTRYIKYFYRHFWHVPCSKLSTFLSY